MARKSEFTDNIDTLIGLKINELRIAMGLSRQQLAGKIGITHQQMQKYEKGINRIAAGRLVSIANALKKPTAYFFEDLDPENQIPLNQHQRMCIEVSRNFLKISNPLHQNAINLLIRTLGDK